LTGQSTNRKATGWSPPAPVVSNFDATLSQQPGHPVDHLRRFRRQVAQKSTALYSWSMTRLLAATAVDNGTVLILITLVVLPIAAVAFAGSGKAWRSIGRGPYAIDPDLPPRSVRPMASPVSRETQEAEVRQMLEAKSYRRVRRGEEPLDVEAETEQRVADLVGLKR